MAECVDVNSTLDFTRIEKLLDSESLNCKSCRKLLQLPVFLVDGVGNVCKKCTLENNWKGTQNEIFKVLLKNLMIPCTNAIFGCAEKISYEHLKEHSKICKYRPVKCPQEGCTWMESQDNLSDHFLENHKENVIENETFDFDLDLEKEHVAFTKLLVKRHSKILLLFKQDKEADELYLSLFKCHENFSCPPITVTFCSIQKKKFSHKIDTNQLDLIDQEYSVEKISCSSLKSLCHEEQNMLTMIVNIPPSNLLLQNLECPICNVTMRPPIFLCETGHSICKDCVKNIKICPTCKATISEKIRNYSFESLTREIFYLCSHKSSGCTAVLSGDEVMDHELNCLYQFHKCPVDDCNFQYDSNNVLNHLKIQHKYNYGHKFHFEIKHFGYYRNGVNFKRFLYINECFFLVSIVHKNAVLPSLRISPPQHHMVYHYIEFKKLASHKNKQVPNLRCKISIKSQTTGAEVTQVHALNNNANGNGCYYIFFPIHALCDSVDPTRKIPNLLFECELVNV